MPTSAIPARRDPPVDPRGLRFAPYSAVFRELVAPRLVRPREKEEAAPVRLSQTVELVFAVTGAAGYLANLTALGVIATALAPAAACLNAAFGFCPGREMYGLIARFRKNNQQGATA